MNAPAAPRERLAWIDLFRGAAVLVMIETHVVNTFLATPLRDTPWFAVLNYGNGLVAPSFLFVAGYMAGLERRASPGKPINYLRRARRLLGLLALGYALHFPWQEIGERRWDDALRIGTQVDVLQCLAAALGLLLGVAWLAEKLGGQARGDTRWWLGVAALAIVAVLVTPAADRWLGLPVPVQAWVNRSTGSWFPLPSWAGFVFLGALVGRGWVQGGRWACVPLRPVSLGLCGGAVLFFRFSPSAVRFSFVDRTAWVLLLAALCGWLATRWRPRLPLFAGQYSLTLYVTHLLFISWLAGAGLPGTAFSLPVTLALLLGVAAASLGATRLIAWWRVQPKRWLIGDVSESLCGREKQRRTNNEREEEPR